MIKKRTNLLNYVDILIKELEDLETIFRVQKYSGELHISDMSKFRVPISQNKDFVTVYVDLENSNLKQNPTFPDKTIQTANITIYVVGHTDNTNDSVGFSSSCINACAEINRLVNHKEFQKLSNCCIGYAKPKMTGALQNGIKFGNSKLCIHVYNFEQDIDYNFN